MKCRYSEGRHPYLPTEFPCLPRMSRIIHKSVLTEIKDIEGGKSAHKALADMRIFPKYMVDLVEIGEKTGNLERVFSSLSEYFKRQEWISKSLRNAVVYPAVLLFMMIFVIVILITKVLPIFSDVYIQLRLYERPRLRDYEFQKSRVRG